jgi:3-deoxy-manno-octulosonate cytidylyltransferase (CMP-KDO synthetase)
MNTSADSRPVAVIPARYNSSRFPGKPLALLSGKPMIEHVWNRCTESGAFSRVIVATDDERIARVVARFGEAMLTSASCASGTDRVAEVARKLSQEDAWVNVQGDEPAVHPSTLAQLAAVLRQQAVEMATVVRPLDAAERDNPRVVKAVLAQNGDALYFSRADIPFASSASAAGPRYAHAGLYGYRRATLLRLSSIAPTPLETMEQLEQLRALENGIRIRCVISEYPSVGVDAPADLAAAEALLRLQQ